MVSANPDSIKVEFDTITKRNFFGKRTQKIDSSLYKFKKIIDYRDLIQTEKASLFNYDGKHFQENILEAADNGVIITVCSKNNEEDALEVFANHPFQLINEKHLSAYRINWQDKVTNIQELSEELNIGLDSIVFIDDNPIERERVKQMLPMVAVPDFPEHPYLMSDFFKRVYDDYFQLNRLTSEDKNKTQQYIANSERNVFKKAFGSVDEYLESLEMELDVLQADKFTVTRIAQMTQKTNQFNLTSKRYTEDDLYQFIDDSSLVHCLSVRDKFGDNGVTVASIILINKGRHTI